MRFYARWLQIPHHFNSPLYNLYKSQYFDEKAIGWHADERRKQPSFAIGSSILAHIPLDDRMDVLDFSTGTGLVSTYIIPRVNKVVAVDTSKAKLAGLTARQDLCDKVEAVCVDKYHEPLGYTL